MDYWIVYTEDEDRFMLLPAGEELDMRKSKGRVLDLSTGKLYPPTPVTRLLTQGNWGDYTGS